MNYAVAHPAFPSIGLSNSVAVITGGGTHLGQAMATVLGDLGATLALVGRREHAISKAAANLRRLGIDAHHRTCDAADEGSMNDLMGSLVAEYGRVDTVVCNAGGSFGADPVPHIRLDDLRATLEANVTTTFVTAQAAARVMMPQRSGSIVTIGSIHGALGSNRRHYAAGFQRTHSAYHASKGAVLSATRALACDLAEFRIRVNCLSPGHIPKAAIDDKTAHLLQQAAPMRRLGVPCDLRGAIALLASNSSQWVTGQNIIVDGGLSVW